MIWLGKYQVKLTTYGATLGLAPAEITTLSSACTNLSTQINEVEAAKAALKNAVKAKDIAKANYIASILKANNKMKASDACTEAIWEDMGIRGGSVDFDSETAKPKFSGKPFPTM